MQNFTSKITFKSMGELTEFLHFVTECKGLVKATVQDGKERYVDAKSTLGMLSLQYRIYPIIFIFETVEDKQIVDRWEMFR